MREAIHRVNGYEKNAYTYYPVLIVGAGESGIAMGCRLKEELGFDQFRIFDRQAGIGGTWWINRYPGVACDIPAALYSFSFAQNPRWTSLFPPGPEIVQYYHGVCEKYGITDKIQLNTDVEQCRWLDDEQVWEVTLRHMVHGMGDLSAKDRQKVIKIRGEAAVYSDTEVVRAKVVVSAVGGLVEPRGWPEDIPGYDTFKGPIFHSARWDYDVDLTDKDVVVVGTGCSAAQFVPKLTKAPFNAKSVTQLMRSPPWVVPRMAPSGGNSGWEKWSPTLLTYIPGLLRILRTLLFLGAEYDFRLFGGSKWAEKERKKVQDKLIRHMKKTVPEKYHEILTPDYGVGCKRRIFDATWFPGLNDQNIYLTTQPLTRVHENSVTIGPGRAYPPLSKIDSKVPTEEKEVPADVIILANGFDTTKWLHPLKVVGKDGKDLVRTMEDRGGAQAYQGTAMDGFPNFFIIFGPNTVTGHNSVVLATENMVNYSLKFIKMVLSGDVNTVDVKHEAEVGYTNEIQQKLKGTVWMSGGCQSWYFTKDGWNSTLYPYTQFDFTRRCMFPKWKDWNIEYSHKGLVKRRIRRSFRFIALALLITGAYCARQKGLGLKDAKELVRTALQAVLEQGKQVIETAKSSL
ncbi:FAD/NAD(P)-binding domain-containing protein [Lepidopterella palustris CBS 459.81]|uniref:FAD/NAD(P)-binding domain-containing protein n=1 Tax=Lepidopterella palustris CBS 459.81 TaxID=1314670 RepID=A0A8E2JHW7_9PEZI|nr:FAD/NAD(P)-binding domain-containing protein [Lepidopterella palustris CBS 459.81]